MASTDRTVGVYEELADWEHRQGSPQARDRFLILAADAALTAGHNDEAERLRARLLEYNPHHMLRPYASLADALKSSEVYGYVADLRGTYPPAEAERLLAEIHSGKAPSLPAGPPAAPLPPLPPPAEVFGTLPREDGAASGPEEGENPLGVFGSMRSSPAIPPAPRTVAPLRPTTPVADEPVDEKEEEEENAAGVGVFMSDALFFLLLATGVILAGYTLARPFLNLPDAPFR